MSEDGHSERGSFRDLQDGLIRQLAGGADQPGVVRQLIERGWPEVTARKFVNSLAPEGSIERIAIDQNHDAAQLERRRVGRGLILIVAGMVVTGGGLAMSDPSFSLFAFAVGVIIAVFGLLDLLFGLSAWTEGDS